MSDKIILITGATSGLGLAMAHTFAKTKRWQLVLAVRNIAAGESVCRALGPHVRAVQVDMSDARSVAELVAGWKWPLHALVNNAGGQFHGPTSFSAQRIEKTLALNVLGPLQLTIGMLGRLQGGTVLNVGSGTHNPDHTGARLFGFRGGRFTSIPRLAQGETDAASPRQAALDRYATSKLVLMAATVELARRHPEVRFINLDPGLMPGTGLVRTAPWFVKAGWHSVLQWAIPLMPGASTPKRSAEVARQLISDLHFRSGDTYGFNARPVQVWSKVTDPEFGRQVLDQSIELLDGRQAVAGNV